MSSSSSSSSSSRPTLPPSPPGSVSPGGPAPIAGAEREPTLARLAQEVHRATAEAGGLHHVPTLVAIDRRHAPATLGFWPVPPEAEHPADVLLGFRADPRWDAFGLICTGTVHRHHLAPADADGPAGAPAGPDPFPGRGASVWITAVRSRDGGAASVIEAPGGPQRVRAEPPGGWVADALARVLELPTPPPTEPLAALVEMIWIDQVAELVLDRPGAVRSWARLARLHPLAPTGRVLSGAELAGQARALERESGWGRMRHLWSERVARPAPVSPPGGTVVPAATWFDDGSFSRWVLRDQPVAEALVPAVLDAVPERVAAELCGALTALPVPQPWAA